MKKRDLVKLTLNRETLHTLEHVALDKIGGGGTYTYSFPCCPLTKPLTHCC